MPRVTVWAVRAALVQMVLGAALGTLLLMARAGLIRTDVFIVAPLHADVWLFGAWTQLALGFAWFVFPRIAGSRGSDKTEHLLGGALVALNIGVLLRGTGTGWIRAVGAGLELAAVVVFAACLRSRVRPFAEGRNARA